MGDRCTGACCQNFYLLFSPEELLDAYHRWRHGSGERVSMNGAASLPLYQDMHLIAPMVVHLGYGTKAPKQVNPTDEALQGKPEILAHRYRCKHFDATKKICTIYEIRPMMCRDYPGKNPCNFAGCIWTERKAKRETQKQRRERLERLKAEQVELVKGKSG